MLNFNIELTCYRWLQRGIEVLLIEWHYILRGIQTCDSVWRGVGVTNTEKCDIIVERPKKCGEYTRRPTSRLGSRMTHDVLIPVEIPSIVRCHPIFHRSFASGRKKWRVMGGLRRAAGSRGSLVRYCVVVQRTGGEKMQRRALSADDDRAVICIPVHSSSSSGSCDVIFSLSS